MYARLGGGVSVGGGRGKVEEPPLLLPPRPEKAHFQPKQASARSPGVVETAKALSLLLGTDRQTVAMQRKLGAEGLGDSGRHSPALGL